jgi:glycosyltransferase involved in cell wall biosynthesis
MLMNEVNQRYNNVLQFASFSAPYQGNFINSLLKLEERLMANNVITIFLFEKEASECSWAHELKDKGKNIYFMTGFIPEDILLIYKILKFHRIKIIHSHFAGVRYHSMFSVARMLIKKKIILVRHLHNHYPKQKILTRIIIRAVSHVDFYISCSKSVCEYFKKINNIHEDKITYVKNAIDFCRLDTYEVIDRIKFGIGKQSFLLLMFGFDYYRKGVDIVLTAISDIAEEMNIYLFIALSENKEFVLDKIKERFNTVPNWIRILGPRNDIASYYHLCDAFVSASRSEGFCYSLCESAYCGLSLIASDVDGQRDLNIPTTFEFTSEDSLMLKKQVLKAISMDEKERTRTCKIRRDFVLAGFDLNIWVKNIEDIYKSIKGEAIPGWGIRNSN